MFTWPYRPFDPALIDVLDWRLGKGQGRLVLLACASKTSIHVHSDHLLHAATHGCYVRTYPNDPVLRLEAAPGAVWDGADLTLSGDWPESMRTILPGRRLGDVIEHPVIPSDRTIVDVTGTDEGLVVHTTRPDPMRIPDLRADTWLGRLRDHVSIEIASIRFVRAHGLQTGATGPTALIALLGLVMGACMMVQLAAMFALTDYVMQPWSIPGAFRWTAYVLAVVVPTVLMTFHEWYQPHDDAVAQVHAMTTARYGYMFF